MEFAFKCLGGDYSDAESSIDSELLVHIIKDDFRMTIDIEKPLNDIDEDGSGKIEYNEFRDLLTGKS